MSRSPVVPRRAARGGLVGLVGLVGLTMVGVLAACGPVGAPRAAPGGTGTSGPIQVVAAESFWGDIAAQLGGDRVEVVSIITSPDTDPHDYEPTAADSRTVAQAGYAVVNGVGYDPWATKLLDANPVAGRTVLDVGDLVGATEGDNPHRWYYPGDVEQVIDRITRDYQALDPAHAAAFEARRQAYESVGLARYHGLLDQIRQRFAGVPVGASESVFVGLADGSGLDLVTPSGFTTAVSEGTDPTAADKATVDRQIAEHQIAVFVYNSQNATPDVQALVDAAGAAGIPVTTITETPPPGASFADWQSDQLQALADALGRATGR
jgi:zinc/manganese transport system substrate-binding protein